MRVISATYGDRDVTSILNSKVSNGRLLIKVNNDICGDPKPGIVKYLKLKFEEAGSIQEAEWKEGSICSLPKSVHNKLGIFYSNNDQPKTYATIDLALKRIELAARNKADILTCVWNSIPSNPFSEVLSWYKQSAHLTQVLQILQLLYLARETGSYDYVSFLEHDCLYGEGIFDYPDFWNGTILCNMNYMGLCKDGWQQRGQNDRPFSQVTMRFDEAIKHFESILPNALVRNSGLVEPQVEMMEWKSAVPSIHVNHGYHFTSHYSIYRKDRFESEIPYWGKSADYVHLFSR
jgi:hypothetical protein